MELVIVFPTTHLTLLAEKVLEKSGVQHRTIMKPRRISSDCGLAIRIASQMLDRSRKALQDGGVQPFGVYHEESGSWERVFESDQDPGELG